MRGHYIYLVRIRELPVPEWDKWMSSCKHSVSFLIID